METAYPHLTPVFAAVTITNVLPSGSAFAVRLDDGSSCYIPVNVARSVGVALGDDFTAKLVPNRFAQQPNRSPWLAVHIARATTPTPLSAPVQYAMPFEDPETEYELDPNPAVTLATQVRHTMLGGGVWTERSMYDQLSGVVPQVRGAERLAAVRNTLAQMFAAGKCAKFAMWKAPDQPTPTRVWYTCYPDRTDVDEWEEA
jgi:hypothetical protein